MYYFQNEEYKKSMDLLINVQVYLREVISNELVFLIVLPVKL